MLNIPQENRKLLIIAKLENLNNYIDCDVIQDSINEIQKADCKVDLVAAIGYAISAVRYRGKHNSADYIQSLSDEISSFDSLYQAIQDKNTSAIAWHNSEADKGNQIRIV